MAKAPSARGLFAATGKKPKPVAVRLPDGSYDKAPHRERSEDDFDRTPPEVTRAFLGAEAWRLKQFEYLWEPAAGDGAMVRAMWEMKFKVRWGDMVDRGFGGHIQSFYDFDAVEPGHTWAIVTNPPFSECSWGVGKARWIKHALDTLNADYLALLLPLNWCSAAGMRAFYERHRPSRIYAVTWRIDFSGQGAQPASHAWYVWDRLYPVTTVFKLLYRSDDPRQERLEL